MIIIFRTKDKKVIKTFDAMGKLADLIDVLIEEQNKFPDEELYYESI
jgi:hypothetical protein